MRLIPLWALAAFFPAPSLGRFQEFQHIWTLTELLNPTEPMRRAAWNWA